jgi:hypothetical protein
MSTQHEIAGLGHSNTLKKFRYTLLTKDDTPLTLSRVPDGWKSGELTFIRDSFYKGVLESFSTNSFDFVKEARDFIQTAYERGGIDYEVTIYIDILVNSTQQYQRYFTGKLDLSTYKIDSIKVSCEIIPTGFQNTVLNRDDIKVDLLNTKFIGGGEGSMAQISGVPIALFISAYEASADADWLSNGLQENLNRIFSHYIPMDINSSEFGSTETFNQIFQGESIDSQKFFDSNDEHTINITGTIKVRFVSINQNDFSIAVILKKNGIAIANYSDSSTGDTDIIFTLNISELDLVLVSGDVLSFEATASGRFPETYSLQYFDSDISINEPLGISLPAINIDSFPVFEFTARIIQLISGVENPLDSNELGRTDSAPQSYGADGDGSLMCMTKGKFMREFPIGQQTFNGSLKKIFKTLNSLQNIGLGFENGKVKIEKEAYFFDITDNSDFPATDSRPYEVNQIIDLSGDVTNELISKEVLPDWYHNEIDCGYANFEYENIQGLKEFNTKSTYATPIKSIKSKLDLVSDSRYDTQGANKLREKPYSTHPTEDVTGDSHVFGFDVKRTGTFAAKTDEDFDSVTGGVDPSQSYNLNFTPRRNLERHGNRIRSMQLADGDEIQWMSSDKNTKLITQKTGETELKAENGDILVNSLNKGYWFPEAYICEAPVNEATIAAIQANPRGVIKIGTDKYGWILEVQTNNDDKKGQFKLLRVNLNNVKVIIP